MLRTSETYLNSLRAGTIHRECASLETRICTGFDSGILSRLSLSFALQKRPALRLLALTLAEKAENESRCYPHFVPHTLECFPHELLLQMIPRKTRKVQNANASNYH